MNYSTAPLYGDKSIVNQSNTHHISQCNNLKHFKNVKIVEKNRVDMKKIRDSGEIKRLLDGIIK